MWFSSNFLKDEWMDQVSAAEKRDKNDQKLIGSPSNFMLFIGVQITDPNAQFH